MRLRFWNAANYCARPFTACENARRGLRQMKKCFACQNNNSRRKIFTGVKLALAGHFAALERAREWARALCAMSQKCFSLSKLNSDGQ